MIKILRKIEDIDLKELNCLFSKVGWFPVSEDDLYKRLLGSYIFVALSLNNELIGFGRAISDGTLATLWDICVDPDFRNKGYGSKIASILEKLCRKKGVSFSIVTVENKNIKFYKKRGYCQQKLKVMWKEL